MANFRGTNIPDNTLDAMRAEDPGKYDRILSKLADAIADNDSRAANDAIMQIAFFSNQKPGSQEYGYDRTEEVSNIHSSTWRIIAREVDPYLPWAAEHVNSSNSSYMLWNGQLVTYDDMKGAAIDGKIVNSWGQRGHTEAGGKLGKDNPYVGDDAAAPTNPIHVGEPGGEDKVRDLWPDVDWDAGGANSGNMEQYDWWESKGLLDEKGWIGDKFDWPEVDPQILKPGDFGFSKETPEAGYAYPPYNYLNRAGIGTNLAYAPGSRAAWAGRETAADRERILDAGGTPTYYTGMTGGGARTDAEGKVTYPLRDLMYYYGGTSPMNVPGGWKPQLPPGRPASDVLGLPKGEPRQPVYPIAQTPLFPSGLLSPAGPLPVTTTTTDDDDDDDDDDDGTIDTYGGLLSKYAQRMGIAPGTANYMYRVADEPFKTTGYGSDEKYDTYRLPVDIYESGGGIPTRTYATRLSSAAGWDPSMNVWRTGQVEGGGADIIPGFNISFADWAGTPGAYTGTEREGSGARHPVFGGLLADPQNVMTADPTSGLERRVPWQSGLLEDSLSPSWLSSSQPSIFGTDLYKNWGFPEMYGVAERGGGGGEEGAAGDIYGTNVIGYDYPVYRSIWGEEDPIYGDRDSLEG